MTFRSAEPHDLADLEDALVKLSRDLGDPYRASSQNLAQALFGTCPSACARLAERGPSVTGAALFSPVFSTAEGGAGVYVSDLWIAAHERGKRLGGHLLREVAQQAADLWGAQFMRLAVHNDNDRAAAFYRKLGFAPVAGNTTLALTGPRFQALGDPDESHP